MRAACLACLVACGYPALPKIGSQDAGHDAARDAARDATSDAPKMDAPPDSGGPFLVVKNYLSWCSVGINGGMMTTTTPQTISDVPGNSYVLTAAPASAAFKLGANMWHHTAGDTAGTGEPGSVSAGISTAQVVAGNAETCVWVCCPFQDGTGCPTADQCP